MRVLTCTAAGCGCGGPVIIRNMSGHNRPLHVRIDANGQLWLINNW